jgi:hypothetical protein
VLLAVLTLVPAVADEAPATAESLRDLLLDRRHDDDRIEHIRVIEQSGALWVGAYVSVDRQETAQRNLEQLYARSADAIVGWELVNT